MDETIATLTVLCWQIVMMGACRAAVTAPSGPSRVVLAALSSMGFIASGWVAFQAWPPTVAFFWWLTAWMVAAISVLWAGAYVRGNQAQASAVLGCLAGLGTLLAWVSV